jgi:hypothetical protein
MRMTIGEDISANLGALETLQAKYACDSDNLGLLLAPSPPKPLPSPGGVPSLTTPLPTVPNLSAALHDPVLKVAWAMDVLFLVDRI